MIYEEKMKTKPGILYVTHEIDVNGASKSLISIIKRMSIFYDIHVLVRGEGEFTNILRKLDCVVLVEPYYLDVEPILPGKTISKIEWPLRILRYYAFRRISNERIARKVAQYVKKNGIVLVHTNSSSTFMGIKIARKAGIRHVWHFREFLNEDFNLHPMVGWNSFYRIASESDKIICVSNSVLLKYRDKINTDIACVYNGLEKQSIVVKKNEHKELNMLQAGVLSQGKGTDVAVRAVLELRNRGFSNVHLYLAGRGDLDFCKEEYDIVKDNVHLLGYVNDLNKLRNEKNIDVELVCSKAEAFGRGTIEAMAYGNAVIGSDTAGTKELIQDGINGYLYRQGDYRDLASKIEEFIYNPQKVEELGSSGKKIFLSKFTIEICISKIKAIYDELLLKN